MTQHPGIAYFNSLSNQLGDPNLVRSRIGTERSTLANKLEEQAPDRRDPDMMKQLKTLEVAFAAAQWTDLNHPNARFSIENAMKGLSNTGNALRSRLLELQATPAAKPKDKFTVKIDHGV